MGADSKERNTRSREEEFCPQTAATRKGVRCKLYSFLIYMCSRCAALTCRGHFISVHRSRKSFHYVLTVKAKLGMCLSLSSFRFIQEELKVHS